MRNTSLNIKDTLQDQQTKDINNNNNRYRYLELLWTCRGSNVKIGHYTYNLRSITIITFI